MGIPRGGVIIGDIIASKLKTSNFDIVLSQKLSTPYNDENSFGAVMEDESEYINFKMVNDLSISTEYIRKEKSKKIREMKRQSILYRNSKNLVKYNPNLNNNNLNVILVDDGAATGATLISVARWIKNRQEHKFKQLIIAIPVAPQQIIDILKSECNNLVVILSPANFETVSQFYKDFEQITDKQVIDILKKWK